MEENDALWSHQRTPELLHQELEVAGMLHRWSWMVYPDETQSALVDVNAAGPKWRPPSEWTGATLLITPVNRE